MVQVVSHVLDGHVLEQSVICSMDVVRLVPDLLSVPLNSTCAPILQPRLTLWEGLQTHVHQSCHQNLVRTVLCLRCAFRHRQVGI